MPIASIRDINMYYEEAGSGEPLILIMGLGGDSQGWALQVPELAKHFRVITFDNRGAGRTSSPDRPYSIAGMADDVAQLMAQLGIDAAHVVGFSMGGYVALELALKHKAKVKKLVLLATAGSIDGYGRAVVEGLIALRRSNLSREHLARIQAPQLYSPAFLEDRARLDRAIRMNLSNPYPQQDHAFVRQCQAILGFDAAARLKDIKNETLVIVGEDDILVPPRNGEKLQAGISGSQLVRLPGGHLGVMEFPKEYNQAIVGFLSP